MKLNPLSPEEKAVIIDKGTERPFTGAYDESYKEGTYVCRQCDNLLFPSSAKFKSGCGWPSFDDHFEDAVERTTDVDGSRIEITCANCGGHLGHVFRGENYTKKDTRHCVNSISLKFIPKVPKE